MLLDKKIIGRIFKKYRNRKDLKQEELAEKVEIAEKHYGRLERGVCIPKVDTFFKIVEILEIPLEEFDIKTYKVDNLKYEKLLQEIAMFNDSQLEFLLNMAHKMKNLD